MLRDHVAERQVIAMAVNGSAELRARFAELPPSVFNDELHNLVATVIRDKVVRGIPVDPMVLAADAASAAGTDEQRQRVGTFVANCALHAPPVADWAYYVETLISFDVARKARGHAVHLVQQLETAGETERVAAAVRAACDDLDAVSAQLGGQATAEPPMSLAALLTAPEEPYDWLVPDLLERMDRLVITGFEGTGKSYLLAQFALAVAGGVHPFTGNVYNPGGARVLVMDLENSRRQIRRRYERIRGQIDQIRTGMTAVDWDQAVRFYHRPEGIDLSSAPEVARAERAIAATAPDLVIAGPLYRMHRLNLNDEPAAREIVGVLDRWRVKYGFTLIVEAHVGHVGESTGGRKLRPTGSSLFLRWPEFGFGLRGFGDEAASEHPRLVEVVAWRGSRDERDWPKLLKHGTRLPWVADDPVYRRNHFEVVS